MEYGEKFAEDATIFFAFQPVRSLEGVYTYCMYVLTQARGAS